MSVNIYEDKFQHASLFGRDVLCTNWLILRDTVPQGWYCYDLQDTNGCPGKPMELVDWANFGHIKTVLAPLPLKRPDTKMRKVRNTFYLHGEELTLSEYCDVHGLAYPIDNRKFIPRPASPEEAGLFYALSPEEDKILGTIGHVRIDFGHGGKEFWHTWYPRGPEERNSPAFKTELAEVVNELRDCGLLKDLETMRRYCDSHSGVLGGNWVQDYGYIVETANYRYCLRCNPVHGDYNAYLTAYDLRIQQMNQCLVGRVTYADGTKQEFSDPQQYLQTIREELPYRSTTGFRHETLTDDPTVRKAVDDILLNFAGEENPRRACNYGLTEKGMQALRDVANPSIPHTYAWFVMTECNTPQEQLYRDLSLDEAIRLYQGSDHPEKRLGVTKDAFATVDIVRMVDGEQTFFADYQKLESFKNDSTIFEAVEQLHQELEDMSQEQGMAM